MAQTYKYFSDSSLIAIYLILTAARNGATEIRLSNACLRNLFNCDRVQHHYMTNFATHIKPFFPRYSILQWGSYTLTLFVHEEKNEDIDSSVTVVNHIPDLDEIERALSVEKIETYTIEVVKDDKS